MGYTTKFDGTITVVPRMDWTMRAAIREYCANADVGKVNKNLDLDGTCDWKASDDFTGLVHNGMEKSYDQDKWLQALINDLLAPAGFICNGIVDAQGEDVADRWRIIVRDNVVERDDFTGPSYAEQVNAPLPTEAAKAINEHLASGDVPKYKRASKGVTDVHVTDASGLKSTIHKTGPFRPGDEKLAELRAKLHPEPEPAQPLSSVGDALRDLGNAIAFKATQGVDAVAGFVTDIEGALELCTQQGDMKPLDALFKSLKAEHDAEATRADQAAAVDDDIPSTGYEIPESVKRYVREYLNDDRSQTASLIHQALRDNDLDTLEETVKSTGDEQFIQGVDDACRRAAQDIIKADFLARSKAPKLTAEDIASRFPMTVEQAQEMIDGGAVESGDILFVNAKARDEFHAWIDADQGESEAEHAAAWQKIHADQAAEEHVRANLKAAHDRLLEEKSAQESREMYEEAAKASQEPQDAGVYKAVACSGIEDQLWNAVGDSGQRDDTALNHWWLIWSNKHSLWWLPNSSGYTENFNNAGRYTFDQAVAIVKKSSNGWNHQQTSLPPTTMVPDPYEN